MGLLAPIAKRSLENPRTSLANPADWLFDALGGGRSEAGITVNAKTARQSAAFACGHVLSQSVAQLPWDVYVREGDNRKPASNRIEDYLLHSEPNPEMTSYAFRYAMMMTLCFHGNFYCRIERDAAGRTRYLWPLIDCDVQLLRDDTRRLVGYSVKYLDGSSERLPMQDVIHVPCIALDGTFGESILTQARNKIGMELAAEKFGSGFFARGSRPSGVLESDQTIPADTRTDLENRWQLAYSGANNSGKTPVLTNGLKWKPITIDPRDAQFLETRNFQVADIARMFRVPGVLIGVTDSTATYASVEQFLLSFGKFTIAPWLQCIEQEFNRKLFPNVTRMYAKLDMRGFERGDLAARAAFYNIMSATGAYTANRILALEDENGFDGGDAHLQPANFVPYGTTPDPKAQQQRSTANGSNALRVFLPLVEDVVTTIGRSSKRDAAWIKARWLPILRSCAADRDQVLSTSEEDVFISQVSSRAATWTGGEALDEFRRMDAFLSERTRAHGSR